MQLIGEFPLRELGAYPDFGHMALDGEDPAMGLATVATHLSIVAAKDATHVEQPGAGPSRGPFFTHVGAGSVNWERALRLLAKIATGSFGKSKTLVNLFCTNKIELSYKKL